MKQVKDLHKACTTGKKGSTIRLKLISSALVLFIIAVGFNTLFNLNSLDKLYIESNVSMYRVIGKDLQRHIERGIQYGKSLKHFIGIDKLLAETKRRILRKVTVEDITGKMSETSLGGTP